MPRQKAVVREQDFPNTWQDSLEEFLWFKQAQGISPRTALDYRYHVNRFFKDFPKAWHGGRLKQSLYEYLSVPCKPATHNIRLRNLAGFLLWCHSEGIIPDYPLHGLKTRRTEGKIYQVEPDILRRLLYLPDKKTFVGLRDAAALYLVLDCGIRPREMFNLLPEDFNMRSLEIKIRAEIAKTRSSRTLPITTETALLLQSVITARHPDWACTTPLLCTQEGHFLDNYAWSKRLREYSRRLGVKITPYALRHCFALQYLRNGGHALALQRTLGHVDLSMTKRYVNLTEGDLRQQHRTASPLNALLPSRQRVRKIR